MATAIFVNCVTGIILLEYTFGSFYFKVTKLQEQFPATREHSCALWGRRHFCSGTQQVRNTSLSVFS